MKCLGFLLLALLGQVYGQVDIADPDFNQVLSEYCEAQCNEAGFLNGGYFPSNTGNCCEFIVCKKSQQGFGQSMFSSGQYQGYSQTCMYPLVWNPANGACDDASNVPGCDESCHGGPPSPTDFVTEDYNVTGECYKGTHVFTILDFDPQCFQVDRREDVVCCGIGQTFSLEECACVGELEKEECDCLMCIPFVNNKVQDIIHDTWLDVTGITIQSTSLTATTPEGTINIFQGCFDGNDDLIRAANFINQYFGQNFSISFHFWLSSQYDSSRKNTIVSNGCCDVPGSIEVFVDGTDLNGRFETEDGLYEDVIASGVPTGQWVDVTLRYCGPNLDVFYQGNKVDSRVLGGDVQTRECGLTLGQDGDKPGGAFYGCLVNFSVCRDCWTDPQIERLSQYDESAVICETSVAVGGP